MDVGCYCVSAARLLAGEPERVTGEQVLGGGGVDVAFAGTMRFAGDVLAHFDAGFVLAARDELEVVGDEGSLFLDDPWHCLEPVIEVRRDDGVERIELERVNSYMLEAREPLGRDPRRGRAAAGARRRGRAGPGDRGAVRGRRRADRRWCPVVDEELQRRLAANETMFREVNEGIERGQWPGEAGEPVGFRCECARLGCNLLLKLTLAEYEHVRAHPRRFMMIPGHEIPEVETVVERTPGLRDRREARRGRRAAEASDPRSVSGGRTAARSALRRLEPGERAA